jgi:ParB family chromosome partitioning protein
MTLKALDHQLIDRDLITFNADQPRKFFDQEALEELAQSISENGLIQPITVRRRHGKYQVVAGERRLRAIDILGESRVPVVVLKGISDERAFILATTENVNRKDMTIIEEANAYAQVCALGKTVAETAQLFGKTATYVQDCIDLLKLRPEIQHMVARGQVKNVLASAMTRLSPNGQTEVISKYLEGRFPSYEEACRYAYVVEKREAQPALLGPLFGEPLDEEAVAKRRQAVNTVDAAVLELNRLALAAEQLLALSPEEIAAAYGSRITSVRDRAQQVFLLTQKTKTHLKTAAATIEAVQ